MNEQTDKTSIQHGLEVAVEQFYKMLPAFIGTLIGAAFIAWLTLRDHGDAISQLELEIAKHKDCATIAECVEFHRRLDAIEAQVLTNTINRVRNEATIQNLMSDIQSIRKDPAARPDPFTGTDGDKLRKRIEALENKQP
jgi:hypothetical protein